MADVTENYSIEFETNADKATRQVKSLSETLDEMGRSGELAGKGSNAASKGIIAIEEALGTSTLSVKKYSEGFSNLRKEVSEATKALQEAAQAYVVGGGTDVLGAAANTMNLGEAKEILAVQKAEGLTAEQVATEVVAANKRKEQAQQNYEDAMRAGMSRLERIQKSRTDEENAAELRHHNQKMQRLQDEVQRETAAVAKIQAERAKLNQENAKAFQQGYTDPKSFFGQANSRDASTGLKASETSWAKAAIAQQGFRAELNKTEISFQEQSRAAELSALKTQILSRHTNEAEASTKKLGGSLPTLRYALYDVSNTLAIAGVAMTGFSALSLKAGIDYERSFADVIRTNDQLMGSAVASERAFESFVRLAGEIPTSFKDLSEIGTLAGQLGVASGRLEDFTRTTAQFSAVTGESIDTTATAFGRLDALLPDVQGNYEALGSAILNVGINSVATEGEVIKITTQLAGVGRQAGLTSAEVVGLAGSLASVGVQPELARGTITRLFGQISRAVGTGGENLEAFAAISGTTADQFASKWNSAPMEATLDIFKGVRDQGSQAEAALRSVGITSVRDVPAILRLAQTMDSVLVPALQDARTGFEEGTQLSENYGVIAETTAAKLQILANNFQSLMAAMGDSTSLLGSLVDAANGFLKWAIEMQKNPVTAFMSQFVVIVTGVLGVLTLLAAAVVRGAAGMIAFRTAMQEAGVASTGLRANLLALTGSISGVNAASATSAGTMGRLTNVMGKVGVAAGVLTAIPLAAWVIDWVSEMRGAVVDVDTLAASLQTLDAGMSEAAIADFQSTLGKGITSLGASTTSTTLWEALLPTAGIITQAQKLTGSLEDEFDLGLARLGEKATSWFTTNLFTGEPTWLAGLFDSSYEELEKFEEAFILAWESASSETQKQAVLDAYQELEDRVVAAGGSAEDMSYNFSDFNDVVGEGVDVSLLAAEANQINEESIAALAAEMSSLVDDVFESINAHYALQGALSDVGQELVKEGAAVAFTGKSMQDAIKAVIDQSGGAASAAANLQVFFDYLVKGGYASASQLTHLSQVIAGLKSQAGGKVVAPTLTLPDFSGFATGMQQAQQSISRGAGAMKDLGSEAKKAKEEVRTLSDYARDLSSIWKRAFDIRFSGQSSADDIQDAIQKIRDAAEASAARVRDLKESITSLSADQGKLKSEIGTLEHFLKVARAYGDSKRASELEAELAKKRAELSKKTSELAEKQKDLKKEQDSQSKSLEGNSKAARDNRQTITDLIQKYQDHIAKLADSGLSQDELRKKTEALKKQFIQEATQLGFNQKELGKYASAFDDVKVAIDKMPRNVTVNVAGLGPAERALKEFAANAAKNLDKVKKASDDMNKSLKSTPQSLPGIDSSDAAKSYDLAGFRAEISALIKNLSWQLTQLKPWDRGEKYQTLVRRLQHARTQLHRGYQSGGYTGAGAANAPAGIVHRGEYVIPKNQVDQRTGLPYASALGQLMGGIQPTARPARGGASGSGVGGPVDLSAHTIQQLARVIKTDLVIDGNIIGAVASNSYSANTRVGAA